MRRLVHIGACATVALFVALGTAHAQDGGTDADPETAEPSQPVAPVVPEPAPPPKVEAPAEPVATPEAKPVPAPAAVTTEPAEELTFTTEELEHDPLYGAISAGLSGGQTVERDPNNPSRYVLRPPKGELSFVGVALSRLSATNIAVLDPLRTGLVAGRLYGSNQSTTIDTTSIYAEQRLMGFFTYAPHLLNDKARLRAAFEIDFIYGDGSNGAGANVGGGVNGDQVNLQTKRLAVEISLFKGVHSVVGLQAITDNVHDPEKTDPNVILHTGYHLGYWGTDAAGATIYGHVAPWLKFKLAAFSLWENVPHESDDVWLTQADLAVRPADLWWVGLSAWTLSDKGNGASGYGLRSPVARANGAAVLQQQGVDYDIEAQVVWLGLNFSRNAWLKTDRLVLDGFGMWNLGTIDKLDPETGVVLQESEIFGFAGLAEAVYRYGRTRNDIVSVEGIYTSGDFDLDDAKYGGVVTGQIWGVPGAILGSHRSLLLMPDLKVINRQFAAVSDISNGGYGVMAAFANGQLDIVANKLTAKVGVGTAMSSVDMPSTGARTIGTEINTELFYSIDTLLIAGLHGGYLFLGDVYESPEGVFLEDEILGVIKPDNPWMLTTSLTWVAF